VRDIFWEQIDGVVSISSRSKYARIIWVTRVF